MANGRMWSIWSLRGSAKYGGGEVMGTTVMIAAHDLSDAMDNRMDIFRAMEHGVVEFQVREAKRIGEAYVR